MSQNAIVPFAGNDIVRSLGDLMALGEALIKSGMLPKSVNTKEAAVAIILKGREIGIGAMEALSSINVIQGKPTTSPQLMMALARRTKELEDFQIQDDGHKCAVTIKRKGQSPVSTSFSMDDAKAMNLSNKDNWIKQARTMRQWRAVAANLRITFPDAISGLYTYEEMGAEVDVNDEGQMTVTNMPVIEGEVVKSAPVNVAPTAEPAKEKNGKPHDFKILSKNWNTWLVKVAESIPFFAINGKPNPKLVIDTLKELRHFEFTDEKANELRAYLSAYAESKSAVVVKETKEENQLPF